MDPALTYVDLDAVPPTVPAGRGPRTRPVLVPAALVLLVAGQVTTLVLWSGHHDHRRRVPSVAGVLTPSPRGLTAVHVLPHGSLPGAASCRIISLLPDGLDRVQAEYAAGEQSPADVVLVRYADPAAARAAASKVLDAVTGPCVTLFPTSISRGAVQAAYLGALQAQGSLDFDAEYVGTGRLADSGSGSTRPQDYSVTGSASLAQRGSYVVVADRHTLQLGTTALSLEQTTLATSAELADRLAARR